MEPAVAGGAAEQAGARRIAELGGVGKPGRGPNGGDRGGCRRHCPDNPIWRGQPADGRGGGNGDDIRRGSNERSGGRDRLLNGRLLNGRFYKGGVYKGRVYGRRVYGRRVHRRRLRRGRGRSFFCRDRRLGERGRQLAQVLVVGSVGCRRCGAGLALVPAARSNRIGALCDRDRSLLRALARQCRCEPPDKSRPSFASTPRKGGARSSKRGAGSPRYPLLRA